MLCFLVSAPLQMRPGLETAGVGQRGTSSVFGASWKVLNPDARLVGCLKMVI